MRVWVWLPPQYDQPAYASTRFPVLVLYPGGDGVNYTQWFSPEKIGIVAAGAASGQISPFVIVEPQLQLSTQLDTECTDLAGQPQVGTFMETDVPAMVKAEFRVSGSRTGWGVGGVSSGAYCASRLLFARPDVFSVGASVGGYFTIETPLAAGRSPAARATSPQVIAAQNPPDVRLRLWAGSGDPVSLRENQAFLAVVRPPDHVPEGAAGHVRVLHRQPRQGSAAGVTTSRPPRELHADTEARRVRRGVGEGVT